MALVLARAMGAELVLVTVFPIIRLRSYVHSRHYESLLRREAERYLAGRADALRERAPDVVVGVETTGSVSAARGLHRLARELDAGMVVVGPSRRRSAGHRVPGPMGARFAHGAPCPVAVASTGPPADGLSRIGVAFAPTEDGEEALRAAAALADRAGATLQVIAVAGAPAVDGSRRARVRRCQPAGELSAPCRPRRRGGRCRAAGGGSRRRRGSIRRSGRHPGPGIRRSRPARLRVPRSRPARRGRGRQHLARPARVRALPRARRAPELGRALDAVATTAGSG